MEDYVPEHVKERLELVSWGKAIQGIHHPKTIREITDARRRLAFEELYLYQLQVREWTRHAAPCGSTTLFDQESVSLSRKIEREKGRENRGTHAGN